MYTIGSIIQNMLVLAELGVGITQFLLNHGIELPGLPSPKGIHNLGLLNTIQYTP